MRTALAGAGPTGLYLAIALARRGHDVTVVDRDTGPEGEAWDRKGVMQFHHPHGFRQQVRDALLAEMPEVVDALLAAGAEPTTLPGQPELVLGFRCRRLTFERVLRTAALAEPGVTLRRGHVDEVVAEHGRAVGLRVDGQLVEADLVLDASGRSSRLGRPYRRRTWSSDCGVSYASRQYELLPGAEGGPTNSPIGLTALYRGYLVIVFPHDNRTLSALVVRATDDVALSRVHEPAAFAAVAGAVPALAAWTDPGRSRPITSVLPGGRLSNTYRSQVDDDGRLPLPGLLAVGDTVCSTNPSAGRGVATSLMQAQRLVGLLDEHDDPADCALAFDSWCDDHVRPWFDDHVHVDEHLLRRWSGEDVDLTARLPSDLIVAASQEAPDMMRTVGPYLAMEAVPATLAEAEVRAREVYATGWRPPEPAGPTHGELAELVAAAL